MQRTATIPSHPPAAEAAGGEIRPPQHPEPAPSPLTAARPASARTIAPEPESPRDRTGGSAAAAATASGGDDAGRAPATTGLEGVVAASTRLSRVDGEAGELLIAGFPVEKLAPRASFEEVVFLLWRDRLPDAAELAAFRAALAERRELPAATLALLRAAAERRAPAIDALRMGAASLSLGAATPAAAGPAPAVPPGPDPSPAEAEALTLVAAFPSLVGAYHRLTAGAEPVPPRRDLGHAAHSLHQLEGEAPDPERARALDTYLATVSDHGLNASTFTARVIVSTGSDLFSAVTGAIGALKGPLHGGAPGPALDTVLEIGRDGSGGPARAEAVLRAKLARGERLMGFGHRVYRVRDPRADVLAAAAERFYGHGGDAALYTLFREVEAVALRLLREHKPGRRIDTNVELYTALLLHGLGLPVELFTPTFAIGRVAGWTAHGLEQAATGRLIRPDAAYTGARGRRWRPVEER